jgi:hypothetical protein
MEEQEIKAALLDVLTKHGVPDKSIVGKLPRGGGSLDFVGHAEITKILIEVDPLWSWQPCGWTEGRPAIHVVNGMAVMWGILTVHGKDIIGVGSVKHDKAELDKELIGDFLRNAAMRFGISLSLWSKQEWESNEPASKAQVGSRAVAKPAEEPATNEDKALTQQQVKQFVDACDKIGLDPAIVASKAKLNWDGIIMQSQLPVLRDAFTAMKNEGGN